MKNLLYVSFLFALVSLCSSEGVFTEKQEDDTKTKYPWTISFVVTDRDDGQMHNGTVEMVLVFEDQSQESFIASDDTFVKGKNYKYPVTFSTYSKLQQLYLRTSGMCTKPLRLSTVQIVSETNGVSYEKWLGDLSMKDKCNGPIGTTISNFHETLKSLYCIFNEKRYENGEEFNMGCDARCTCTDGNVGCVDMCPPYQIMSQVPCQSVSLAGECCPTYKCEGSWNTGDCERPDLKRFTAKYNNGYPSAVYVCSDKECTQERVGAVLLNGNWALAPLIDNWSSSESRLFIARSTESGIRRFAIDQIISNATAQLTMFKLKDFVGTSLNTQYANLPPNADQCMKFINRQQCPFTMVGWQFDSSTAEGNPKLDSVGGHSADVDQCNQSISRNDSVSAFCLSKFSSSSPCRMQHGGPVYVQIDKDVNYLVGMKSYRSKMLNDCNNPVIIGDSEKVVNLCSYLGWVDKLLVTRPVV